MYTSSWLWTYTSHSPPFDENTWLRLRLGIRCPVVSISHFLLITLLYSHTHTPSNTQLYNGLLPNLPDRLMLLLRLPRKNFSGILPHPRSCQWSAATIYSWVTLISHRNRIPNLTGATVPKRSNILKSKTASVVISLWLTPVIKDESPVK